MNGKLDLGEPFNYTYDNIYFDFYGMKEGSYSIMMVEPTGCRQLFPGYFGYQRYIPGDGYIDKVVYFTDGGNVEHIGLHGGNIMNGLNNGVDFSYILGNHSETFLSFYHGNSIIVTITNDVIVNNEGDDIFINTYLNSVVNANVSVSFDGIKFIFLGELNDITSSFDLETINFNIPVRFIRLYFYCGIDESCSEDNHLEHLNESRNIISIYGFDDVTYSPEYSYYLDYTALYPIFFYDCSVYYSCELFCKYRVNNEITNSCMQGCELFTQTKTCDCLSINPTNNYECELGCTYKMEQYVYPNYTIYMNSKGVDEYSIANSSCGSNCFDNILNECTDNIDCHSFSMDGPEMNTFNSFQHYYHNNSFFLAKNSIGGADLINTITTTSKTSTTTSKTYTTTSKTYTSKTSTTTSGTYTTTSKTSTTTSETSTTTSKTYTTTSKTSTTTSKTSTTTSETYTTTSETYTTTSESYTTTSESYTTTSETSTITINKIIEKSINQGNKKKFSLEIIIIILLIVIVIVIFLYTILFYKRNKTTMAIHHSYTNPVYNTDYENNNNPTFYQDVDMNRNDNITNDIITNDIITNDNSYLEIKNN